MKKYFKVISMLLIVMVALTSCASMDIVDRGEIPSKEGVEVIDGIKYKITTERIEIKGTDPRWFFAGSDEDILDILLETAREKYGYQIEYEDLRDVRINSKWSGLSMLMYFDLFGYVANYKAECNVIISKEPIVPTVVNTDPATPAGTGVISEPPKGPDYANMPEPNREWDGKTFFMGKWVDDFGDEIVGNEGDKFARSISNGDAYNTAGSHDCRMKVDITRDSLSISGWEYGDNPVDIGNFSIKAPDGKIFEGNYGWLRGGKFSDLILHIEQNPGVYKFNAYEDSKYSPTRYMFSVDLTDVPTIVAYFGWHHVNG